jgi:hypothetical protein
LHLTQLDLQAIDIGADFALIGKQAERCKLLLPLVEDFQGLAPGGLPCVVDLAQVHHGAMHHSPARYAAALHDAEVAVLLAVLLATMDFQVHVCSPECQTLCRLKKRG